MDWAEEQQGIVGEQAAMNLQFASAQSADDAIVVTDTSGRIIFAYDPDKDEVAGSNARWYQGAILSAPSLKVGQTCNVYVGGDVQGIENSGIYDVSQEILKSDRAKQQCFSSVGSFARPAPPPGPPPTDSEISNPRSVETPPPMNFGEPPMSFDTSVPPPPSPEMSALPNSNGDSNFVLKERVNGFKGVTDYDPITFSDVTEGKHYDSIMWAVGSKIATGETDGLFHPELLCTRGQTVLYLWRAAGSPRNSGLSDIIQSEPQVDVPINNRLPNIEYATNPFTDVYEGDLYYHAVLWAVQNGITKGITETSFAPEQVVTRAQAQTFLYRWSGSPRADGDNPFTDVFEGKYYYDAVRWSVENGITNGTTPTTFEPSGILTKAQILTFLYRYSKAGLLDFTNFGPPSPPDMRQAAMIQTSNIAEDVRSITDDTMDS